MIDVLLRKGRQVLDDPVLRRWLLERFFFRTPGEPDFVAHRPPYLGDGWSGLAPEEPRAFFPELTAPPLRAPVEIPLPGETVRIEPGREAEAFDRPFADTETLLALHRFAWVPLMGDAASPALVAALWRAWAERFPVPSADWPWHPYTAAERAVNILSFARRHGLPAGAARLLAAHGPAIAERLEYFGDHHSSNHLSNNGRGLYLLGLALGLPRCAELGARILTGEAARIFRPSGILREGSSHYHLLLTRNYAEAWLAARTHHAPEEDALRAIAARALKVVPPLVLPGGMPLIGDISPDCPPAFLDGLHGGEGGWVSRLDADSRAAFAVLRAECGDFDAGLLAADGWLRADFGPWSGLWHASPEGWSCMPGHGHQDCGGFELHHEGEPVIVDPGRGAYGDEGEAALYRSSRVHSLLSLDGADPYPPNRPYYDPSFRARIGGPSPALIREPDGVVLRHAGFVRMGRGAGAVTRRWRFHREGLSLNDAVEGTGTHTVLRRLVTPLEVKAIPSGAVLRGAHRSYRLTTNRPVTLHPVTRWTAYGQGAPATAIEIEAPVRLPWTSSLALEAL